MEAVGKLEELRVEVKESISDEVNELEMIRDQCRKDTQNIGEGGGKKREKRKDSFYYHTCRHQNGRI